MKPRRMTQKEVQDRFLHSVWKLVDYWAKVSDQEHDQLSGLAHSILTLLDGVSLDMPPIEMYTDPHPTDADFRRSRGENWFPKLEDRVSIHGSALLNDIFFKFGRKHGYIK